MSHGSTACRDTAQEGDRHFESSLGVVGDSQLALVGVDSSYFIHLLNRAIWNFGSLSGRHVIGVGAVVIFLYSGDPTSKQINDCTVDDAYWYHIYEPVCFQWACLFFGGSTG